MDTGHRGGEATGAPIPQQMLETRRMPDGLWHTWPTGLTEEIARATTDLAALSIYSQYCTAGALQDGCPSCVAYWVLFGEDEDGEAAGAYSQQKAVVPMGIATTESEYEVIVNDISTGAVPASFYPVRLEAWRRHQEEEPGKYAIRVRRREKVTFVSEYLELDVVP